MARLFLTAADGRQRSVRYAHAGELMGGLPVMNVEFIGSVQLIVDSEGIHLDVANFRQLIASDAAVAEAMARDLAARYEHSIRTIAIDAFGSVAQRLAFDLLDRACRRQLETGILETTASQQELADSIGSVREVVARALRELRDEGFIKTYRRRVVVIEPKALDDFAATALDAAKLSSAAQGVPKGI